MKKIVIIVAVLALAGGGFLYWQSNQEEASQESITQTSETLPVNESDQTSTPVEEPGAIEEISLAAVGSYTGDGEATRTIDGEYTHTVTANIGEPAEGKFYEGWIVVNAGDFISTGELTQESEGQWSLVYTSNQDLSAYKNVVITEETEANGLDNIPEDHVLEGSFL